MATAVGVVLAFGALSASVRFWAIGLDRTIGHSDSAAYAEIGRSLAEGRGLDVRYVSTFYVPYERGIDRPDDHWPPLMGMMIAPFFATLGVSPFSAKIPAVLAGAFGLPLATLWLGIAVSRRAWVGLVAALLVIGNRQLVGESLTTLSDVTLAMLLTAFLAALVTARSRPRFHVLAGLLAGLAYYAKLSELMLLGLLPVAAFLISGPGVLRERWMYAGWCAAALVVLPWLASNAVHYGSPLHTTHNYVSGFIGLDRWEERHYRPYWGDDLPRTSDRWTRYAERYWPVTRQLRERFVRLVLLGSDTGQADWYRLGPLGVTAFGWLRGEDAQPALELTRPETPLMMLPVDRSLDPAASQRAAAAWRERWAGAWRDLWRSVAGGWRETLTFVFAGHRNTIVPNLLGFAYALAVLIGVPLRAALRGRFADEMRAWPRSWGIVAALVVVGAVHGVLLIHLYSVGARFTFTALPVMAVLGMTGLAALLRRLARPLDAVLVRRWSRWHELRPFAGGTGTCVACGLLLVFAATHAQALQEWQRADAGLERTYRASPLEALGRWIGRHLPPDAVIMARYPWELRFHSLSGVRTVALPWTDDPRELLGIAWYYGVTHVVPDPSRPALDRYLAERHPGIRKIEAPLPLYAIDWSLLPEGEVRLPHQHSDPRTAAPPPA